MILELAGALNFLLRLQKGFLPLLARCDVTEDDNAPAEPPPSSRRVSLLALIPDPLGSF